MKKITAFIFTLTLPLFTLAQVGIGTTTPNSDALLEVFSADKGILLPRLALTNSTNFAPLTAHVSGMLVYNTATAGDVTPGFYFNDGTQWNRVASGTATATGWDLNGNSGTNSSTNFLGTTDNVPLVFRVNNIPKLRIETNGTIATLNTGNSVFIGQDAGANDDLTDNNNVFIGRDAGVQNTSGSNNTAIGRFAMENNTIGNNNIAFGLNALRSNINGSDNIAIGDLTLEENRSNQNIAIGNQSFRYTTNGSQNVGVGYWAGQNNVTGNNNVAIGNQALTGVTNGSNNTAVGRTAYATGNFTNSTAIGYNTNINGNNRVHLGNASVTTVSGQVNYSTYSDRRIKENIKEDVVGLDFIMKLRPVTYNLDIDKQNEIIGVTDDNDHPSKYDIEKIKFSGFIAQEVEQAANESNYNFSGVKIPENDEKLYMVSYAEFVVPLVKAVQEQQDLIDELEALARELKAKQ